jgi:hypothetical protein
MGARRTLGVLFPLGGVNERTGWQRQPPWTTPYSLNVFPDEARGERERGGPRFGISKAFSELLGAGAKIRLLDDINYVSGGAVINRALASAGGVLYRENPLGTLEAVSSDVSLASDRVLDGNVFDQVYFIADNGPVVASGSDGDFATDQQVTSASVGDWGTAGVDADYHAFVIESHNAIDAVQTITFTGTATAGSWRIVRPDTRESTDPLAWDISTAALETALEAIYGTGNIASVTGTVSTSYVVTFAGDFADTAVELMEVNDEDLTGATVAAAHTTVGASTIDHADSYEIASVAGASLNLVRTLRADLTGVVFRVERCPKRYNPSTNTLDRWFATVGSGAVPVGRTIFCLWHARAVMAGGIQEPHTVSMSRLNNFYDWDDSQEDSGSAVTLGSSDTGIIPEPVTALIPHADLCLIIGCRTSLWVMRGDPAAGGELSNLSYDIGVVDKRAWCKSPEGYLYFLSYDGLYYMANECGDRPKSISRERLPTKLLNVDTSTYTVSMAYCVRYRMLQIWLVHNTTGQTIHYWVDIMQSRNGDAPSAYFFPQQLGSANYEPFVVHSRTDNPSNNGASQVLLGCRDGYIRRVDHAVYQDDGTNFSSSVFLGPLALVKDGFADAMIHKIVGLLPETTGDLTVSIHVGDTPEAAYNAAASRSYTWSAASRNKPNRPRVRGAAAFLKIVNAENNNPWSFERIDIEVEQLRRLR